MAAVQQAPAALGPILLHDLGLTRAELGLLSAVIIGGGLVGMIPLGLLSDRYGEARVMPSAVLLVLGVLFAASFQTTYPLILAAFIAGGIAGAAIGPGSTRALFSWFAGPRLGIALGIRQAGVAGAGLLAAAVLPAIGLAHGWAVAMRVVLGFCLVTTVLFMAVYRQRGAVVRSPSLNIWPFFRDRDFLAMTAYFWCVQGAAAATTTFIAVYGHQQLGLSLETAPALLVVTQLGGVAGRIGFGQLSDRLGRRPCLIGAGLLGGVAALAMAAAGPGLPAWVLGAITFLLGMAVFGWAPPWEGRMAETLPRHGIATAMGASLTVGLTGVIIAGPALGALADHFGSFRPSWLIIAAGMGGAAAIAARPWLRV
jgi:MFS family permease